MDSLTIFLCPAPKNIVSPEVKSNSSDKFLISSDDKNFKIGVDDFESKKSDLLGEVKLTTTQINAGVQHNVVPADVKIVLDVRVNDEYTNIEIYDKLKEELDCEIIPRNLKLNSSSISKNHKIIKAGKSLNFKMYGSPTLSDQAKIDCNSIKLGPGDSLRSHTANEFIYINEIETGIKKYIELIEEYLLL